MKMWTVEELCRRCRAIRLADSIIEALHTYGKPAPEAYGWIHDVWQMRFKVDVTGVRARHTI